MKRGLFCAVAGTVLLCAAAPSYAKNRAEPKEEILKEAVVLEGEVIDAACYMKMGASGKSHIECARKCAEAGVPLGLLTKEGDVYFLLKDKDIVNDELMSVVGQNVKVSGKVVQKGGSRAIFLESFQPPP